MKPKARKPKAKPNPDAGLPAADRQIAVRKRLEATEDAALRKEICRRVGKLRDRVHANGNEIIAMANEARSIGILIQEAWDKLSGKQMTLDFWHQQQALYKDSKGRQITLENLKWMVKISRELKEPVTELRQALGYRQPLFALDDYRLEGAAPYANYIGNGQASEQDNYFTMAMHDAERFGRQISERWKKLTEAENFKDPEKWPEERKTRCWEKIKLAYAPLEAIKRQLGIVEV